MAESAGPIGTLIKGAAGLEAGKFQRDVAYAQARDELATGSAEELRVRDAARMQMGVQVAGAAESGFSPGTGSALRSLEESAINAELDRLNIRRAAQARAAGLRIQGKMAKQAGQVGMTGAMYKAGQDVAMMIAGAPPMPSGGSGGGSSASAAMASSQGNYGG